MSHPQETRLTRSDFGNGKKYRRNGLVSSLLTICERSMGCKCNSLKDYFYHEEGSRNFYKSLVELEVGNWVKLFECPACNQLWAIDAWDKYQEQVVRKVSDRSVWEENSEDAAKKLLLESRGGYDEGVCINAGCNSQRVKGVVYCIDHLYEGGARK